MDSRPGDEGDFGRKFVLDAPMVARIRGRGFTSALDVGCGEGRFCRMLRNIGVCVTGIDPTTALIERARSLDPDGDYRLCGIEDFAGRGFDLVVSYLSLIDIPDMEGAVAAMAGALRPGGTLLIANLTSFSTAAMPGGWCKPDGRAPFFAIDNYLDERSEWVSWRGIRIRNWHRPLSSYMQALLGQGLTLVHFEEPAPTGGDPAKAERYRRVPWFHIMEWCKPA